MKPATLHCVTLNKRTIFIATVLSTSYLAKLILTRNFLIFANITFHENPFSGSRDVISVQRQSKERGRQHMIFRDCFIANEVTTFPNNSSGLECETSSQINILVEGNSYGQK
jgi:hypothetical protein